MKKSKMLLSVLLSLSVMAALLTGLVASAAPDMDTVLYVPAASAFTASSEKVILSNAPAGGMHVVLANNPKGNTDIAVSNGTYTLEGLHFRVENLSFQGDNHTFVFTLAPAKESANMYTSGLTVEINTGTGFLRCFSYDGYGNLDTVIPAGDNSLKGAAELDIRFEKDTDNKYIVNVNSETYKFTNASVDFGLDPESVYLVIQSGNGDGVSLPQTFDLTMLHDGKVECHSGEDAGPIVDLDPHFYAPAMADFTASSEKVILSDAPAGGMHVVLANNPKASADIAASNGTYALDGLHFRVENLSFQGDNHTFVFTLAPAKESANMYTSGLTVEINTGTGFLRCFSYDGYGGLDTVIPAGDNSLKGAAALDISFEKDTDNKFIIKANSETYKFVNSSNNFGLNPESVYVVVLSSNGDGTSLPQTFDLTVLHGGNEPCQSIFQVLMDKVNELEGMIDGLGTITLEKEASVTAARNLYGSFNTTQLSLFDSSKLAVLEAAEEQIAELKQQQEGQDKEAADSVIALINAIGEDITLASEAKIVAAEQAYEALTSGQKELVTNYSDLQFARTALDILKEYDDSSEDNTSSEENNPSDPSNPETGSVQMLLVIFLAALSLSCGLLAYSRKRRAAVPEFEQEK